MPVPSPYAGSVIGPYVDAVRQIFANSIATFAMAAVNTGWCARFTARDDRDIASVYVNWSAVTAAGVVACRVETIDATTGKPSGTLYDASAAVSQAPVAGFQAFTFAVLPTAKPTPGNEYGIVLLTTTGGTTHTLRSHVSGGTVSVLPTIILTAADGTTRSNFAEVTQSVPIVTVVYEDGVEEVLSITGFGFVATGTALDIYGAKAAGVKFVVPTNETWVIDGIETIGLAKTGAPNDLRVRVLDSANAAVSGTTRSIDKDSLTGLTNVKRLEVQFAASVSFTAGTYRIVFDDAAQTGTNTNKYTLGVITLRSSAVCPTSLSSTSTADLTAGPIVWADSQTVFNGTGLMFGTDSASAGGSDASDVFGCSFIDGSSGEEAMSVRSGQTVTLEFTTAHPTTKASANADSLPAGTLVVNGADNAATVTVTNVDTGRYKFSVTLPTLAVGDTVEVSVAATVATVPGKRIVWRAAKDIVIDAAGLVDATMVKSGPTGAAASQTARDLGANLDAQVTSRSSHTAADVWTSPTRTLSAFAFSVTLTAPYDPAKTAAQAGDAMAITVASGNALVAATAAAVTTDHGAGSYVRNTEPVDVSATANAIKLKTDLIPAVPAAVGSAMTLADGAITDAKITFPAETAGRPTTFLAVVRRAWEWVSNKRTRDRATGTLLLRNAADTATLETQTQSTAGTVDTQTKGV